MKDNPVVFNIADCPNKLRLMKETIETLSKNPDLGFVVAHSISVFIDGLASGHKGKVGTVYKKYLKRHFPELCKSLRADLFYTHIRCKAVHEFALKAPLALAHSQEFTDENSYVELIEINKIKYKCLNVDRLTKDFLEHIEKIKK